MTHRDVLAGAAQTALAAPSVFNSQPWRWRVDDHVLELLADRGRQLNVIDPDGHLLLLSCGAALHHACVALAAAGWRVEVELVDSTSGHALGTDLLARVRIAGTRAARGEDRAALAAIARRRTDRRPFGDAPVPASEMTRLQAVAEEAGAHLHPVRMDQMPMLALAVARAGTEEMANPAYRGELMRWANRPPWSADGVPAGTTVRRVARRVPVREFSLVPNTGVPVAPGGDRGAAFAVLYGDGDAAADWLGAGQALSAVMLTAVTLGLGVAPTSDVIEVPATRALVRALLAESGFPYLVLRVGSAPGSGELARAPRRDPQEVIYPIEVW
jgi:nitroreductase